MNPEMKAKALEKLMMVLDEVLGEDVMSRMKSKVEEKTGMGEEEKGEEEGEEESPEIEIEMPEEGKMEEGKPAGVGVKATEVELAAMPKPGLMKKMRGLK
jgi:hypothetical protein